MWKDLRKSDLHIAICKFHSERKLTETPCQCRIQQFLGNKCSLGWSPGLRRQQTPCRSSFAYWLFESESNMSLLSVLGRIALWLLLWWPSRALVCACVHSCASSRKLLSEFVHTHLCQQTTPGACPFFTLQLEWWMTGWRTMTCAAALRQLHPPCLALLSSARLCRATDTHRVDCEAEEGGSERGAPRTPAERNWRLSVSRSYRQKQSLTVQQQTFIPTRALSPSLSLDPAFLRLFPCLFFCCSKVLGEEKPCLLTQTGWRLITDCITPQKKMEIDLRTDKERKARKQKELEKMRYSGYRGGSETGGGGWAEEQTGRGEKERMGRERVNQRGWERSQVKLSKNDGREKSK